MIILEETEKLEAIVRNLVFIAKQAKCKRSKCGSMIVADDFQIIGYGYNSMPCDVSGECFKDNLDPTFKSDKTCCIHAEQRAIMDALKHQSEKINESTLFFIRLDENEQPKHSGKPYCSICSKMALDAGIKNFVLWHKEGWTSYDTKEYNDLTFKYSQ